MTNPSANQPRESDGRFGHKPAAEVDLAASESAGAAVVRATALRRLD